MLDALTEHFAEAGPPERLHMESFEHFVLGAGVGAAARSSSQSGPSAECDGTTPILVAGEEAGADLPYGCRMGICHTWTGRLTQARCGTCGPAN